MTGHDRTTSERNELTRDELEQVSGGVVCITHPRNPCMPAVFSIGLGSVVGSVGGAGGSGAGKIDQSDFSIFKVMDTAASLF